MMRWFRVWVRRKLAHDTRVIRLDPHVPVGLTADRPGLPTTTLDRRYESLWRSRVASNEARRRERAFLSDRLPAFLRRQAD